MKAGKTAAIGTVWLAACLVWPGASATAKQSHTRSLEFHGYSVIMIDPWSPTYDWVILEEGGQMTHVGRFECVGGGAGAQGSGTLTAASGDSLHWEAAGTTVWLTGQTGRFAGAVASFEYKLLEQIGEGGFGVVYMAEQEEPVRRRVALKIIKLGMDTQQVVARFEAERQALAMMDHPNIAKVLDAGATETGRPYFVMELVRACRSPKYCDRTSCCTRARAARAVHPGLPGRPARAPEGHHPPRHQALEHPGHAARRPCRCPR
jgi:hypothetical protein